MAFLYRYIFCFHEYQKIEKNGDEPFENKPGKIFLRNRISRKTFEENSLLYF